MTGLKLRRIFLQLTQYDIQKNTGIAQFRISLLERGYVKPKPGESLKLSEFLKVPVEELFPTEALK